MAEQTLWSDSVSPQQLEADENDSAVGDDDNGSNTTSLAESIFAYRHEHGRTYHAYKAGSYFLPNDDDESDRLDLQNHIYSLTFEGKLFLSPLKTPRHCLDIGCGTGIWAIDFADQYPECEVIGTDLSPIQPSFVPPNLRFLVDDAEDEWIFSRKFDFIHARTMGGCFKEWKAIMKSAFDHLAPGGWFEIQDYDLPCRSRDGSYEGTHLQTWCETMMKGASILGRPMDVARYYKSWMEEVGFVDVQELMFYWPTNPWPKDKKLKELGKWVEINLCEGMEAFSLAIMTRALGWSKEEVEVFAAKVRSDLKDRSIHAYFLIPVVYGRKPEQE